MGDEVEGVPVYHPFQSDNPLPFQSSIQLSGFRPFHLTFPHVFIGLDVLFLFGFSLLPPPSSLPAQIVNSITIEAFKKKLDKHLASIHQIEYFIPT